MCPRLRHMFRRPMRYRPKHVRQCGVFQGGVRRREAAQKHIRRWDVLVTSAHATQQANETRWGQRVAGADTLTERPQSDYARTLDDLALPLVASRLALYPVTL